MRADAPCRESVLRPEYVVVASLFHMEAKWLLSGDLHAAAPPGHRLGFDEVPAGTCRFAVFMRGILKDLEDAGGDGPCREALSVLGTARPVVAAADVR